MKINVTRLRLARMIKGWSQRDLAVRVGVTPGTISNLEGGRHAKPSTIKMIADILGVPMKQIVTAGAGGTKPRRKKVAENGVQED